MRLLLPTLAFAALSLAEYQEFFFTANGTCPGLAWDCAAGGMLAACAYDSTVDKTYCCGGAAQGTCRINSPDCLGSDGGPSSTQQLCSVGDTNWCCLKDAEVCTPKQGQINVCIATQPDTIANVSQELLNDTYSSLTSAAPSATTFSFDAASLVARALSTSSSIVASSQAATTTSATVSSSAASATSSSSSSESSSLSGGAIAGIVIGCVFGIAAILIVGFLLFRRRRNNRGGATNEASYTSVPRQSTEKREVDMAKGPSGAYELPSPNRPPAELDVGHEPRELPGGRGVPSELPGH
ncbi:hypothetical protein PRZ48_000620 [Zasmidium cellare]|uniref:Uncharacterized protein n=1 Tax=Zasmidium cellare TaxID=395010 RepID=A0ABR0EZG7_ZASCE|nr:hypothetical protein PRZ48_000620 [Zasmidium cellare]